MAVHPNFLRRTRRGSRNPDFSQGRVSDKLGPNAPYSAGGKPMFKVGGTLVIGARFTACAFVPAAMMLAPTALAQTMGEYGTGTVGSNGSSFGTLGSSIGPENSVGSSIGGDTGGGGLSMGVASGGLHSDVVNGQGPPRTVIIGGDDNSHYAHSPTREDDEDDAAGDDWTEVK